MRSAGGGSAAAGLPASGCSGDSRGYSIPNLAQKGLGCPECAYRGPKTAGAAARGGRRRGPAAWSGRSSRTGWCGGPPGFWIPRFDSGCCCEGAHEVRAAGALTAAWNCHGGPSSPELPALRFPATRRVGVEVGTSVVLLGSWRGCCAARAGLRCGGAVWSLRRRGSAWRGCTGAAARVCGGLWRGG